MNIKEQLQKLIQIKEAIRSAILSKDVNIPNNTPFNQYANYIAEIQGATLITKSITQNGTYNASSDDADGYSQVTVNIPSETSNVKDSIIRTIKDEAHCTTASIPKFVTVGSPTSNLTIYSNFSNSNYLYGDTNFSPQANTWEINLSFTLTGSASTRRCMFNCCYNGDRLSFQLNNQHFVLALRSSSTASGWDISGDTNYGSHSIQANKKYYVRLKYTGTEYTIEYSFDKTTWYLDKTISNSSPIWNNSEPPYICALYNGSNGSTWYPATYCTIDVKDWNFIINNTIVWQGMSEEQIIF